MSKFVTMILIIFSMVVSIGYASAWTSYTHTWICDKAGLSGLDCANADYSSMQSEYHDLSPVNHHCANNDSDCNARKIADKYVLINSTEAQGFAAHLYADSLVPVHWYSTDYNTCHKIFEDKVEEKLRNSQDKSYRLLGKNYDFSSWNLSMNCIAKFGKVNKTVELYADNIYMDSVVKYVAEKIGVDSAVNVKSVKEYDLTPILIVMIILIILVFVLFFYFGLKNKKK
jgi:hypothetical protein